MRVIDNKLIVLAMILLCQFASTAFTLSASASTTCVRGLSTAKRGESSQLSMAAATRAALIESKRNEPFGKAESGHHSYNPPRLLNWCQPSGHELYRQSQDFLSPAARKGLWLLHCALLR